MSRGLMTATPAMRGLASATALIIPSDAPAAVIRAAKALKPTMGDLLQICTGTGDLAKIQAGINAVESAGGGETKLYDGNYATNGSATMASSVSLVGGGETSTTITLDDSSDVDMIVVPRNSTNVSVRHIRLDGNKAGNSSGSCIKVLGTSWRVFLTDMVIFDAAEHGIEFTSDYSEYSYEPIISRIHINGCDGDGCNLGWVGDLFSEDLYVEYCTGYGVNDSSAGSTYFHLHVYGCYGAAGYNASIYNVDLLMVGSYFETNQKHGAIFEGTRGRIFACFAFDNGQLLADTYDALYLTTNSSKYTILGLVAKDGQGTKTQRYGVKNDGDDNIVAFNQLKDNSWAGYNDGGGSGNIVTGNVGYIHSGEIREFSGSITAGGPGTYTSVDNDYGQDVGLLELIVRITTPDGNAPNIDADLNAASDSVAGVSLFDDITGEVGGFYSSIHSASGQQTVPQLWQSGAGNRYLNMAILDNDGSTLVAKYYGRIMGL